MLNIRVTWEPGAEQWVGVLKKRAVLGDGSCASKVPLAGTWGLLGTWPTAAGKSPDFQVQAVK